eukprot:CFRG1722T1
MCSTAPRQDEKYGKTNSRILLNLVETATQPTTVQQSTAIFSQLSVSSALGGIRKKRAELQRITCGIKEHEVDLRCMDNTVVNASKECCRWQNECANNFPTCDIEYCCTSAVDIPTLSASPSPTPSPSKAVNRITTCSNEDVLCNAEFDVDPEKPCCRVLGECGDLEMCRQSYCCSEPHIFVCECNGAVVNGQCYSTIARALGASSDGNEIWIGGDKFVSQSITFNTSVSFIGVYCDNRRAKITATFTDATSSIFHPVNPTYQEITIDSLDITAAPGSLAGGFRTLGSELDAGTQKVQLIVRNSHFYSMKGALPGVAIFVGNSAGLIIEEDCLFMDLTMESSVEQRYAGGAALAVIYLDTIYKMTVGGIFRNNKSMYPHASLHSGGGAIYLDYMAGDIAIDARFTGNMANQGPAVHAQSLLVTGTYSNNDAQGRGGVIATNMHDEGSILLLSNFFSKGNTASTTGGVLSVWSSDSMNGTIIFDKSCTFINNRALYDESTSLYNIFDKRAMSEDDWMGKTITLTKL